MTDDQQLIVAAASLAQESPTPQLGGYFKENYPEVLAEGGVDWVRRLPEHERHAFAQYGLAQAGYGHLGGLVRAETARRDRRGRFMKNKRS